MTNKELWDLRLSLIRDVMTLTDKQIEYIFNNLKGENNNAVSR